MGRSKSLDELTRLPSTPSRRQLVRLAVFTFVGGSTVTACGPPAPSPTAIPTTQAVPTTVKSVPKPRVKWRTAVPSPKILQNAFQYMPIEKGFFAEEGLDVEILHMPDVTAIKALVAGEIDLYDNGAPRVPQSIDEGADLKILGSFLPRPAFGILVKKEINSLRDLYGKTYAVSVPGDYSELYLRELFRRQQLDVSQVTIFAVMQGGTAAQYQALAAGKIDATIAGITQMVEAEKNPDVKLLLVFPVELPNLLSNAVAATNKALRERKDLLVGFCVAYARGVRYCLDNRNEAVALASKITGQSEADMAKAYDWIKQNQVVEPNFLVKPEQIDNLQEMNASIKAQSRKLPLDQVATWEIQKEVVARLGEYKGK